jgi:hypothetical protein
VRKVLAGSSPPAWAWELQSPDVAPLTRFGTAED